jgi:hypothetical protein
MSKTSEMFRSITNKEEDKSNKSADNKRPMFGISLSREKNKNTRKTIKKILN